MSVLLSSLRFLPLEPAQLSLAAVLRNGQCFLWKRARARATLSQFPAKSEEDGLYEWFYGHKDRTIVLRQDAAGIHYRSLFPARYAAALAEDELKDTTLTFLRRYFVLDVSLPPLYSYWSQRDRNFALKTDYGKRFGGIRILRQPTWECLIEFICSSNNNIGRIEGMLKRLCRLYGERLPSPASLDSTQAETEDEEVYAFPKPSDLIGDDVTAALRTAGFGYRDAYVTRTASLVIDLGEEAGFKEFPEQYLETLAGLPEAEAKEALLQFSGVGPKVADCILLFGLGFGDVVPVDTHVYQIAVRDYGLKGSKDSAVSKAMYSKVREKLQQVWGDKPGWAHQILFTADLSAFADFMDPLLAIKAAVVDSAHTPESAAKIIVKKEVKKEEEEDYTVPETPLPAKRRRTTVTTTVSITPKAGKRSRSKASPAVKQEEVSANLSMAEAALAYPTPPATPASVKSERQEEQDSPMSLAERTKLRSSLRRSARTV